MGELENRTALLRLLGAGDTLPMSAADEYDLRAEDYVMEMPQSGERIVGRDNMRAMQDAYPAPPAVQVQRVIGSGDLFVIELRSDYGGEIYYACLIVEFRDGKIAHETRYYGQPFPAPDWRAQWVETKRSE